MTIFAAAFKNLLVLMNIGTFLMYAPYSHKFSRSRNNQERPENRSAGVHRTPVFGYSVNFHELLKLAIPMPANKGYCVI